MKATPTFLRSLLPAFSGSELKLLLLLLTTSPGAYSRISLSLGEIERRLSVDRKTVLAAKASLEGKGVIRSKVITDRARAIPITAYEVNEKALKSYISLFEICCRHCGTATAPTYIKHHPRPKSQGGKETFYLCANCHAAHHYT